VDYFHVYPNLTSTATACFIWDIYLCCIKNRNRYRRKKQNRNWNTCYFRD